VASGVKREPHGGMNNKMKSWTVSWLSHKTKVTPGLRGSQVMCGDWRRLHQVRGVCGGSPENHRVTRLSHKDNAEDRAWLSSQNRSNRFWRTGLTGLGSQGARSFEAEDTRRDRKACVEAMGSAVAGHPSDGATKTNSQSALCHTCFSKENQVQTYMHARIYFHISDI
jgi:hypothetical protein